MTLEVTDRAARAARVLCEADEELRLWAAVFARYEPEVAEEMARRRALMRRLGYLLREGVEGGELERVTSALEAATACEER